MKKLFWGVLVFSAGVAAGWAATRQFSPEWVEAIGTWIGAAGTIAAIVWAVHAFQHQSQERVEDRQREIDDVLQAEQVEAECLQVRCFGGGGYGPDGDKTMTNVKFVITNGTFQSVTIQKVSLPGVRLKGPWVGDFAVIPPHHKPDYQLDIEPVKLPDDQFSGKPFTFSIPVIRYRIRNVVWERTGDDPPLRCSR